MAPATVAMPLVMTVISSDRVSLSKYGRTVRGAAPCPRNRFAATVRDSAPLARITRCMTTASRSTIRCMMPQWYRTADRLEMTMISGSTWNAKTTPCSDRPRSPNTSAPPSSARTTK